jgi:hypothetical protein
MVQTENTTPHEDADDRNTERKQKVRRAEKALDTLKEALAALGAEVPQEIAAIERAIEALRPPEPRRCKEYLRALSRSKKGILGIPPEDVVLYCRCQECRDLRVKLGMEQPEGPTEIEVADTTAELSAAPGASEPSRDSA